MSNKDKLHVRLVVGGIEENYIAESVDQEGLRKRLTGQEEDYIAKVDKAGRFEKGEIFFYKRAGKMQAIVLPKQIENPVSKEKQDYPYIRDSKGMRVAVGYLGSTTAGFLYGEYVADPGDAVTMVHVSEMFTKNVKKIHGTAKFPVALILVGIGAVILGFIVFKMVFSGKAEPVNPGDVQPVTNILMNWLRIV